MKYLKQSSKSGVYEIRNLVNGKRYVGGTVNFRKRRMDHLKLLRANKHYNAHLQSSFNKHGSDNFEFKELAQCVFGNQKKLEQWYLDNETCDYNFADKVVMTGNPSNNRKFSEQEVKQIRWLYNEGYLPQDISKKFSTNRTTIHDIVSLRAYSEITGTETCDLAGLRKQQSYRSTKFSHETVRGIREKFKEGYNAISISQMLDCTPQAIFKIALMKSYKNVDEEGEINISWFNENTARKGNGQFEKGSIPHNKI